MSFAPVVRAFRETDRAAVVGLWEETFPDDPPWNAPAAMIDRKLGVQPELLLVAELDGRVVGAAMAGFDGVRGWLHHIAVKRRCRRGGIGRALVVAAEEGLRALGCPKLNLQVRADNAEVVAFYAALGYAVEERVSLGKRL